MKPTYQDAIRTIKKAWEGRKDSPDYPDYDDINTAIGALEDLVAIYYRIIGATYETRN